MHIVYTTRHNAEAQCPGVVLGRSITCAADVSMPSATTTGCSLDITGQNCLIDSAVIVGPSLVVLLLFSLLVVILPVCICVRRRRRRREMEVGAGKPASSEYKIQSTHTDVTDGSFCAERSEVMELRPANSMLGFASVSLRVPSSDPLPSDDTSAIRLRAPANVERPPGRSHAYHTLEPPNLASGGGSGREEVRGGGVGLNPDNRTNLREVTQPFNSLLRDAAKGQRSDESASISERQHQHPGHQQSKLTALNSSLPPIPRSREREEGGYDTMDAGISLEGTHNYDDVEILIDTSSGQNPAETNSKEHEYDKLEGDETAASQRAVEKPTGKASSKDHPYDVLDEDQTDASRFVIKKTAERSNSKEHAYDMLDGDQTTSSRFVIEKEAVNTTHVLVTPNPTNPRREENSNKQGSKGEAGNRSDNAAISRNGFRQRSLGAKTSPAYDDVIQPLDTGSRSRNPSAGCNEPLEPQQPRRTTYSSAPNKALVSPAKPVFDDPLYDAAFDGSLSMGPPGNITASLNGPPTAHPRTRSLMQTHRNLQTYELTENFMAGDLPKPADLRNEASSSLPTPPAAHSHDENKCTNLFDDPEYATGLNWKR